MHPTALRTSPLNRAVLAAGLGFFVDAFDLFLFNVYRIPSLMELGLSGAELREQGTPMPPRSEMVAMIAYLQSLGVAPPAEPAPAATPIAAAH